MLNTENASVWQVSIDAEHRGAGRPEAPEAPGRAGALVLTSGPPDPMFHYLEHRLIGRLPPPQAVERDRARHQIDLRAHQAVGPVGIDLETLPQHLSFPRRVRRR